MSRQLEKVAGLLVGDDTEWKAGKLLAHLVGESDARGGAVLSVRQGRLVPFSIQNVDLETLARLNRLWSGMAPRLKQARVCRDRSLTIVPLLEAGLLTGVLLLDAPRAFDAQDAKPLLVLLGTAVTVEPARVEAALATKAESALDGERERVLALLEANSWNIAQVARMLGVTRPTLYRRLQSYNVARKKVPLLRRLVPV